LKRGPALENLTGAIVEICRSGLSPDDLRERVLARLRRAVPFDAAFWATVDPATLLFTQPHQEEIPPDTVPYFIQNEFLDEDVNKWTTLARDRLGVRTHLAEGIRTGLLASNLEDSDVADAPGLVLLAPDGSFISTTVAGERWLDELGHPEPERRGLPVEIHALAARLRRPDGAAATPPRLRVRTQAGRWAVLHASLLPARETQAIAVIIEEPSPAELAPVLMMAYGLTKQERAVTGLVCRGLATREIAERLHISPNTVQDHLKSIFDKTGVRSRRELVTAILQEQYLPRAMTGQPVGSSGFFAE
jgi:DNA-binding CsgD family transcriptional regulator